jgi:hypothetical protein
VEQGDATGHPEGLGKLAVGMLNNDVATAASRFSTRHEAVSRGGEGRVGNLVLDMLTAE